MSKPLLASLTYIYSLLAVNMAEAYTPHLPSQYQLPAHLKTLSPSKQGDKNRLSKRFSLNDSSKKVKLRKFYSHKSKKETSETNKKQLKNHRRIGRKVTVDSLRSPKRRCIHVKQIDINQLRSFKSRAHLDKESSLAKHSVAIHSPRSLSLTRKVENIASSNHLAITPSSSSSASSSGSITDKVAGLSSKQLVPAPIYPSINPEPSKQINPQIKDFIFTPEYLKINGFEIRPTVNYGNTCFINAIMAVLKYLQARDCLSLQSTKGDIHSLLSLLLKNTPSAANVRDIRALLSKIFGSTFKDGAKEGEQGDARGIIINIASLENIIHPKIHSKTHLSLIEGENVVTSISQSEAVIKKASEEAKQTNPNFEESIVDIKGYNPVGFEAIATICYLPRISHYVAYIKGPNNDWYLFNDNHPITKLDGELRLQNGDYIASIMYLEHKNSSQTKSAVK